MAIHLLSATIRAAVAETSHAVVCCLQTNHRLSVSRCITMRCRTAVSSARHFSRVYSMHRELRRRSDSASALVFPVDLGHPLADHPDDQSARCPWRRWRKRRLTPVPHAVDRRRATPRSMMFARVASRPTDQPCDDRSVLGSSSSSSSMFEWPTVQHRYDKHNQILHPSPEATRLHVAAVRQHKLGKTDSRGSRWFSDPSIDINTRTNHAVARNWLRNVPTLKRKFAATLACINVIENLIAAIVQVFTVFRRQSCVGSSFVRRWRTDLNG